MQKSKSTLSFAPTTEHTEFARDTKPQRRSSLDTFVIPGRTRLPSSKTSQDATDIQVAQALLNHTLLLQHSRKPTPISPMAARGAHGKRLLAREPGGGYSSLFQHDILRDPPPHWALGPDVPPRLQPHLSGQDPEVIIISPHRRAQTAAPQAMPQVFVTSTKAADTELTYENTYDGTNDRSDKEPVSRMTSMTWSTVSQRVLSDSSGSSHVSRATEFKHEYNELAERHGLPPLTGESEGTSAHCQMHLNRITDEQLIIR